MIPTQSQLHLFTTSPPPQFLKWVGNKQRHAIRIAQAMPETFSCYIEPFVGSGAVLGTLAPHRGIAGDNLKPLIEIWQLLQDDPELLLDHYRRTWQAYVQDSQAVYARVRESYNKQPNPFDLLFLCRSCYGGVMRFTREGKISTPIGPHRPISPDSLAKRMVAWRNRVQNTQFVHASFDETMEKAGAGDIVYCDPPYVYSQAILYGSQSFSLKDLFESIEKCVSRGAKVLLSIDGRKKSGKVQLHLDLPRELFKREVMVNCGRSMLRRFQKKGSTMVGETVHDRLLLTW